MSHYSPLSFPASSNEREHERTSVAYPGSVRELGSVATPVTFSDLTKAGCRIKGADIRRGAEVWARLGKLAPVRARVIWAKGGEAGLQFYQPLQPAELRALDDPASAPKAQLFTSPNRGRPTVS